MSKLKEVTKKIADAAMIAQLIGSADLANARFDCIEIPSRKLHDCPDCEHIEYSEQCDHRDGEWDCVASAIDASVHASHLWLGFSNAVGTTTKDRNDELRYLKKEGAKRELKEHVQLYAWVDSIREGGIHHRERGLNDLEVAALLLEGRLPPGWKLVSRHRRSTKAAQVKTRAPLDTGGLPMVQVRMMANGPAAEASGAQP